MVMFVLKSFPLSILQVNTSDTGGGAERIALNLHNAYNAAGHTAWFAAGWKKSSAERVFQIHREPSTRLEKWVENTREILKNDQNRPEKRFLRKLFHLLILDWPSFLKWLGLERYHYPESKRLINRLPYRPDIIHFHNLHGGYFDLGCLSELTQNTPGVITMHDQWLFTGHCAHAMECERWHTGCGKCPDLIRYPGANRDATHINWLRKRRIYSKSHFSVVTPSQWLFDKLPLSIIKPDLSRVIHNGVDQKVFQPGNQLEARQQLNIPKDAFVLLYVANHGPLNPYKDHQTIEGAIARIANRQTIQKPVTLISLGGEEGHDKIGSVSIEHRGFIRDPQKIALYYQSSDLYLHASMADTFPTTVLEALSSGCPVIATAVGGIPEQIVDEETGFLVKPHDAEHMAVHIERLANDRMIRTRLSENAVIDAKARFDELRMVKEYIDFYYEVIQNNKRRIVGKDKI
jgi:glycosyltransferase involved in cell wall biosynthesis